MHFVEKEKRISALSLLQCPPQIVRGLFCIFIKCVLTRRRTSKKIDVCGVVFFLKVKKTNRQPHWFVERHVGIGHASPFCVFQIVF